VNQDHSFVVKSSINILGKKTQGGGGEEAKGREHKEIRDSPDSKLVEFLTEAYMMYSRLQTLKS